MCTLSIITINRNNALGLEKTMQSVFSQTYNNFDYVVVDGASTDGSVAVIRRFADQFGERLKWISEPDKGIYNAMNKGIRMSTGEYIMILNSSDLLVSPTVIEDMIAAMNQCGGTELLLGNIVKKLKRRKNLNTHRFRSLCPKPMDSSMYTFYRGTIPHDAAFIRRDVFEKYGYYDENLKICSDWKLFLDAIALGGITPMHVDLDMVLFDMSGISESGGKNRALIQQERREYLEEIIPPSILKDYDLYGEDIHLLQRLHRFPFAFKAVRLLERCLFKYEKWFKSE